MMEWCPEAGRRSRGTAWIRRVVASRAVCTGSSRNREGSAMRCVSCGFDRLAVLAAVTATLAVAWYGVATPAPSSEAATWGAATSLAGSPPPPGLRMVWHEGVDDPASTLDRLQRAGYRVDIALPPHAVFLRQS